MNKLSVFALCAASAALLSAAAGCIASKPPVAISKSTYTGLEKSEQQLMPEGIKLLTLDEAQQIAIQNNPSFKSAYFAIAAARARYYQSFSSYLPTISPNWPRRFSFCGKIRNFGLCRLEVCKVLFLTENAQAI